MKERRLAGVNETPARLMGKASVDTLDRTDTGSVAPPGDHVTRDLVLNL